MNRPPVLTACAVTYAALLLAAAFVPDLPEGADGDGVVLALLSDPRSRGMLVLLGYLMTFAGLVLVPWLANVALLLRERARVDEREGRDAVALTFFGAGIVHVVMLLEAGGLWSAYATGVAVDELEVPRDPTLFRVLSDHGFGTLLVPGLLAAGAMMLALHVGLRGTGALPGWVHLVGGVLAASTLVGFVWLPQFAAPAWVLLVSLTLRFVPARESQVVAVEG